MITYVPYIRNFWHIGKPWERFQCWIRRIYFLTVPDDHTVVEAVVEVAAVVVVLVVVMAEAVVEVDVSEIEVVSVVVLETVQA